MAEYIEREALRSKAVYMFGFGPFKYVPLSAIENLPVADVAPVVHGRWIPVPSSDTVMGKAYTCSECDKMRFGSFKPNYCPNCGARMDGE